MPEEKEKLDPRNLTPEEMNQLSADLKGHLFNNWKGIDPLTKFFIRGMIKEAMMKREGTGGVPKKKLKYNPFGGANPEDFTSQEQDSLQTGLRDHILNDWDNFTVITKAKIRSLAKEAQPEPTADTTNVAEVQETERQ